MQIIMPAYPAEQATDDANRAENASSAKGFTIGLFAVVGMAAVTSGSVHSNFLWLIWEGVSIRLHWNSFFDARSVFWGILGCFSINPYFYNLFLIFLPPI